MVEPGSEELLPLSDVKWLKSCTSIKTKKEKKRKMFCIFRLPFIPLYSKEEGRKECKKRKRKKELDNK